MLVLNNQAKSLYFSTTKASTIAEHVYSHLSAQSDDLTLQDTNDYNLFTFGFSDLTLRDIFF